MTAMYFWEWWDENPPEYAFRDQCHPEPSAFLAEPGQWQPTNLEVQIEYETNGKRHQLEGWLSVPQHIDPKLWNACEQIGLMLINRDIIILSTWQINRITPLSSLDRRMPVRGN